MLINLGWESTIYRCLPSRIKKLVVPSAGRSRKHCRRLHILAQTFTAERPHRCHHYCSIAAIITAPSLLSSLPHRSHRYAITLRQPWHSAEQEVLRAALLQGAKQTGQTQAKLVFGLFAFKVTFSSVVHRIGIKLIFSLEYDTWK